jgi:hypothetical protein
VAATTGTALAALVVNLWATNATDAGIVVASLVGALVVLAFIDLFIVEPK